jgi:hypothetical protein
MVMNTIYLWVGMQCSSEGAGLPEGTYDRKNMQNDEAVEIIYRTETSQ